MSQDRGKRLQKEVAAYLSRWWPHCESTPGGRRGTDVLGTPGVVWEVKTARNFSPAAFCKQAAGHARNGEFHPVVYLPPGIGGKSVGKAMAILEMDELMHLLVASGYAPAPALFEESALCRFTSASARRNLCGRSGFSTGMAGGGQRAIMAAKRMRPSVPTS